MGGTRTYYHYSDKGLIGEYDASGNEIKSYGYKPGSSWTTDPLFMKTGGQYYFYHNDHLGTPQKMTDISGAVVWSAKYESFGKATVEVETVVNNLRFPGQYWDEETGLCYNWFRYYDAEVGRYLKTDPIGFWGGVDFYVYVINNPVNYIDYRGHYTLLLQIYNQVMIWGPMIVDFGGGFVFPGPPPPSAAGAAGAAMRAALEEVIDFNEIRDKVIDGASSAWETYYKYDINPNWQNDPSDPYYEGEGGELYLTAIPSDSDWTPPNPEIWPDFTSCD